MKKKRKVRVHNKKQSKQRTWKDEITPFGAIILFLGLASYLYIGSVAITVYAAQ